jgi:hypothetical protein
MVKEIGGTGIYWPEMNIQTIDVLLPGSAYFVAVSQNTSIEFSDSSNYLKEISDKVDMQNLTSWQPKETGSSHILAIRQEALNGFSDGDYIGVFTSSGVCSGLAQINRKSNLAITVFGDDLFTNFSEGFVPNEQMAFKLYCSATGEISDLQPEFDYSAPSTNGMFLDNGISIITHFKSGNSSIDKFYNQVLISPNPVSDRVTFRMKNSNNFRLTITDIHGNLMLQQMIFGSINLDLENWNSGVYIVKMEDFYSTGYSKLIIR